MLRIANIVPCRDKAGKVAATVRSLLAQTYPTHVVVSDQGSLDGSADEVWKAVRGYNGPHKVSVLRCPVTGPRGMHGMNAHLDWIVSQVPEDYFMVTSADDLSAPERTERVAEAFEKHRPDMVLTGVQFEKADGTFIGVTAHPSEDGMVTPSMCLEGSVGGSTSHAFTRDFYKAVGGFGSIAGFDAYWPFLATVRNGAWFIRDSLHIHVQHADDLNTGLEGIHRAADEAGKLQVEELMHFQVQTAYVQAGLIMERWGLTGTEAMGPIINAILGRAVSWCRVREQMSLRGIEPKGLKT